MGDYLFISDAAKEVKVESHVLRYWEEELHLPIKRNELGHRYYTEEDVERFKQIKSMKERGLQLKAIKMILRDGKLDVLSMEETGIDRSTRRNQVEPGADVEFLDTGIEDSAMYQSQPPISEIEMSQTGMPEARGIQPRTPQAGMSEARGTQPRTPQAGMPETRGAQPRASQTAMSEERVSRSRLPQADTPETRRTQPRLPQADMQEARAYQSRMMPQTGIQEARGPQPKMPQANMPEAKMPQVNMPEAKMSQGNIPETKMFQSRLPQESRGLAIDIISAKEKEPVIQESREDKSRRLQWLLQQLIRQTLQENNIELCREIRDSVVKELDYQFRMQEEREDARDRMMEERNEEHYRKMDELIRKKSRRLRKMKPDKEQGKGFQDKKGYKADERNKGRDTEEHDDKNGDIDEWDKWSKGTGENNQKDGEAKEQEKKGWKLGEKSKWKQDTENLDNALQSEQTATMTKKKRRFF